MQQVKDKLHPRNKHRERYNFKQLIKSCPELAQFVKLNAYKNESIDFFNPQAVKMLNTALLKHFYNIDYWDVPKGYLCPPIPGRADYIHHINDLINATISTAENQIRCFDVGLGASCIYPIIGNREYGWSFVGSDTDAIAIDSANKIIEQNPILKGKIELRLQANPKNIFQGIIQKEECFDLTICNPPFHKSIAEAQSGTLRKLRNLKQKKVTKPTLNFGGQSNELWCEGGESQFVHDMIHQSKQFSSSCFWFSTLVSKRSNLESIYKALKRTKAVNVKTIPMGQGNKISRIVAWTFLTEEEQKKWKKC